MLLGMSQNRGIPCIWILILESKASWLIQSVQTRWKQTGTNSTYYTLPRSPIAKAVVVSIQKAVRPCLEMIRWNLLKHHHPWGLISTTLGSTIGRSLSTRHCRKRQKSAWYVDEVCFLLFLVFCGCFYLWHVLSTLCYTSAYVLIVGLLLLRPVRLRYPVYVPSTGCVPDISAVS